MKIFAIVVTYNGKQWYDRCLGSLMASEIPLSVIAVDNHSDDGTVEYLGERFPSVLLMPQGENLGFAGANNIGIRYALDHGADYVFLLNQDAWIEKDTVGSLVGTFEATGDAGIVSPVHLDGKGTDMDWKSATNMPGEFVSDAYMGKLKPYYPVPYMNAAAWLLSAGCIRTVGGFDTNLFSHYGEDGNYCQRVCYHGLKIYVDTAARICHDRESRKGSESEYQAKFFSQKDTARKLEYGNINYNIDIDGMIRQVSKSRFKARMRLRFKDEERLDREMEFLEKVKLSRDRDARPGLNWL